MAWIGHARSLWVRHGGCRVTMRCRILARMCARMRARMCDTSEIVVRF